MLDGASFSASEGLRGASMAGPPLSARPSRSGGASYPGYVYSFWDDADRRCLYVGKAGAGPSGPGMRIQAHYVNQAPWALAATTIRVQPFPGISDDALLDIEAQRIAQLRPRGNKQRNWAHHDRAWMLRTRTAHAKAQGVPVPLAELVAVWWATMTAWVRRGGRLLGLVVVVDAVAALIALLIWTAVG